MGENGISAAEAVLLNGQNQRGYDDCWGGNGMMYIWTMMLFWMMGGNGGFGWGNNAQQWQNGALTRAELSEGFNFNDLQRKVDGLTNGMCDGFYAQSQQLNNLGMNLANMHNQNQMTIMQNGYETRDAINQLGYNQQNCCCQTQRLIERAMYENAKNTCDIMQNDNRNTQRIVDTMTQNQIQDLRDKLSETRGELSQERQTASIVSQVRPPINPTYLVGSPYQEVFPLYSGYGYGNFRGQTNPNLCGCSC